MNKKLSSLLPDSSFKNKKTSPTPSRAANDDEAEELNHRRRYALPCGVTSKMGTLGDKKRTG